MKLKNDLVFSYCKSCFLFLHKFHIVNSYRIALIKTILNVQL
jgi:hypothetical protein